MVLSFALFVRLSCVFNTARNLHVDRTLLWFRCKNCMLVSKISCLGQEMNIYVEGGRTCNGANSLVGYETQF